ncbi:MAG: cytochrome C [Gammaproteobacteria bacterium]|nr:cytochrome C [Gammaproteobacteria bacterium]MDH3407851.1 cytochrome C [Gammaproteobacteria bacterium]
MNSMTLQCLVCVMCLVVLQAQAEEAPDVRQPLRFEGYPGAPEFEVVPRKDELFFYPCAQCHETMEPNPEIRTLNTMHDAEIEHGRGRIWCLSCHNLENRNYLNTLLNELVDFDEAHLVCGGCHANRHKDWYFGAHGKRVASWQGDRTLYNCTHCHNAHSPAIQPRAPKPAPPVRAGLERQPGIQHEKSAVWDTHVEREEQ